MRLHIERERQRANTIRHQLTRDHPCPYCQGELGDSPQCDHIIPLTLWGRSVEWNMVWVCARCNLKKGGRGLNEFVEAEKLNRVMIFWALKQLGKRL
jgi:5-methylcytosine-specific restriction endonuclease McrA